MKPKDKSTLFEAMHWHRNESNRRILTTSGERYVHDARLRRWHTRVANLIESAAYFPSK